MNPFRRLFALAFEPQPRRQPTRPCPTLAEADPPLASGGFSLALPPALPKVVWGQQPEETPVFVSLADLRKARP